MKKYYIKSWSGWYLAPGNNYQSWVRDRKSAIWTYNLDTAKEFRSILESKGHQFGGLDKNAKIVSVKCR